MFQVGERIGDYEVLQILGAGGMGQVYKVRHSMTDRVEAMKVLLPDLAGDPQLADRFLREIKVQASLVHKNIAQLYTARREGDQIIMLLEFVDGLTLDQLLRRGPLNTNTVVSLFSQVLDALAFAHSHGVVHRDIKPQNIMVTADGTAKLMDFGIARMSQDQRLTQTGRTLGSLYYMSPEQIRGNEDIDGRSDLYSLGITLYEAATGTRPFDGSSDYSIMAAHLQVPPVPPVERDNRLPQMLSDVIMAAIEKDREQRFQSAGAFKAALQHVGGSGSQQQPQPADATLLGTPPPPPNVGPPPPKPIISQPVIAAVPPPLPPPPVAQKPAPPPMPPAANQPPQRSNAGMLMGVGALAFAALAGLGVWQYPRMFPPATQATSSVPSSTQQPAPSAPAPEPPPVSATPAETASPAAVKPVEQQQEPVVVEHKQLPTPVKVAQQTPPQEHRQQQHAVEQPPVVQQQQQQQQQQPQQQPTPVDHAQQQQPQQPAPQQQQQEGPQMSPAQVREIQELRQRHNHLSIQLAGCREGMQSLEEQQRAMGVGLRGDLKQAAALATQRLREAQQALRAGNIESARENLDLAERSVEFLAKALGR